MMTNPAIFDNGPFAPCPPQFNMAAHTFAQATRHPQKTALEVLSAPGEIAEHWTYGALAEAIGHMAGGLRALDLDKGDRVLLRLGNSSDFPILFFAANAIGAVPVPVSSQLTPEEVAVILADLEPKLICRNANLALPATLPCPVIEVDTIRELRADPAINFADTEANDPAYMIYTSGTGGRSKGVVHAQRAAWARRMMWDGWYGLRETDRMLHAGAFNWTYTLGAGLTDPWAIGATALVYTGGANPAVWPQLASKHQATIFAAVPGLYRQILSSDGDLTTGFADLRHGLSAGEALPDTLRHRWNAATDKPLYQALGMSEVSTYVSFSPDCPPIDGRAGSPQAGRRIAILDETTHAPVARGTEGLLAVSGRDPGLMLEYWRRPKETAEAYHGEWFLTGDKAILEDTDHVIYCGRADDVITAGGYRVNPQEVEAVLVAHRDVHEAAVTSIEIKPEVWVIGAFIVPEASDFSETQLAEHCAEHLARYKCPRMFAAVSALPRNANGKLQRRALKGLRHDPA